MPKQIGKRVILDKTPKKIQKDIIQKKANQSIIEEKEKTKPACQYYQKCGGCRLQNMTYKDQLEWKQNQAERFLKKFGAVNKIIGTETPFHCQNKVNAVIDFDRKGNILSGICKKDGKKMIPVDHCLLRDKKTEEILETIKVLSKSFKYKIYAEDTGYGLLRYIVIKRGMVTGETMVILVLASPILPSKNNFIKALRKAHPEITSIIVNINERRTNAVLGDKEKVIFGKGYIEDVLCGCRFRISSKSAYPVNPGRRAVICRKALEYAGLKGEETVLDAYCGIGTLGLCAGRDVKEVIGTDRDPDVVKEAVINTKCNQMENVCFYHSEAGEFAKQLSEWGKKIDVVFMEPEKMGSDEDFLSSVTRLGVEKIVYVSCNLESLARDLKYLKEKGYQVKKIQPIDVFAMTERVDCVILLEIHGV